MFNQLSLGFHCSLWQSITSVNIDHIVTCGSYIINYINDLKLRSYYVDLRKDSNINAAAVINQSLKKPHKIENTSKKILYFVSILLTSTTLLHGCLDSASFENTISFN